MPVPIGPKISHDPSFGEKAPPVPQDGEELDREYRTLRGPPNPAGHQWSLTARAASAILPSQSPVWQQANPTPFEYVGNDWDGGTVRRMVAVVAAGVGAVAAGVGAVSLLGPDDTEMTVARMEALASEARHAPILLPVSLPDDYFWAGPGGQDGDGQTVWARTVQFASMSGGPLVEVCAKGKDQKRACQQDDDPYTVQAWQEGRVFISFESSGASDSEIRKARRHWEDVELTTDYSKVDWLIG